ncbi:MAG TPA: RyR domain-containing protein, partial [Gammaproteobacteria bacterium]
RLDVPMFVRLQRHQRLGAFAGEIERIEPYRDRLRVFGALEELLAPEILFGWRLDKLARSFHEHYMASRPEAERGHAGLQAWERLPEQFRVSNRRAADHVHVKLAQLGLRVARSDAPRLLEFSPEEIELLAQLEHRRWFTERRLLGWSHGAVRDATQRRNPLLLEWARLPEEARAGNREAIAALPQILARAGFEIRRD